MPGEVERREALKRLCGFADWGSRPPVPGGPFIWNFFLPTAALPEWRAVKSLAPQAAGGRRGRRYILEVAGSQGEALDLMTFECPSGADAREAVIDYVATCAGLRLQAGAGLQYDFGELSWGGAAPGGTALFVRGNMFVVVRRALGGPRVEGLARWVDRLIGQRPGEGDRGGRVPPEMKRLDAGPLAAGRRAPLAVEAHDPLDRPVWYQVFAQGAELSTAEGRLLLTPAAGEVQVEAFAFNENGHWARGVLKGRA